MLKNNGQAWYDIIQSSRQFSPKPTWHSSSTPPSLVNNRVDRQRRRNQLLSQHYGPNQHHYKNDTHTKKQQKKHIEEDAEDDVESDDNNSSISSSSSSSCSTVSSPVPTTMIQRRRRGNLPKTVTAVLKQWLVDHCRNPYPTEAEKTGLKDKTGLTLNQISNWFINARRRLLPQIIDTMLPQYKDTALNEEDEESFREPIPRQRRKRRSTKDDYLYVKSGGIVYYVIDLNNDDVYSCLCMIDAQLPLSNTSSSSSSPPPPTNVIRKRRQYNKRTPKTNPNTVTSSPSKSI